MTRFRQAIRVLMLALGSFNVGAHDWRGVEGCAIIWLAAEIGVAFQNWGDRRHRDIARQRRRLESNRIRLP